MKVETKHPKTKHSNNQTLNENDQTQMQKKRARTKANPKKSSIKNQLLKVIKGNLYIQAIEDHPNLRL